MRVLDLFSGIGAYTLGLKRAGFETVAFCESDEWCQRLLEQNFPGVPILDDVCTADFSSIEAEVIVGGFPCQDISRAGKRAGITGARSGLFWEMVRAIRMVRPHHVIVENVAALLDRDGGMGVVLGALAKERYDTEWDCISLGEFGAPHGRPRLWLTASSRDRAKRPDGGGEAVRRGQRSETEGAQTSPNANGERELQSARIFGHIRRRLAYGDVRAFWAGDWKAKFEAFRRMDVRAPTRLDRARDSKAIGHLGNCNPPQVPEAIGRAIMAAEKQ